MQSKMIDFPQTRIATVKGKLQRSSKSTRRTWKICQTSEKRRPNVANDKKKMAQYREWLSRLDNAMYLERPFLGPTKFTPG